MQVIYNIFEQRPAEKMFPVALEYRAGIIAPVPFEQGLLTRNLGPDYSFAEGDWRTQWLTPKRLKEATRRIEKLKSFLTDDHPTLAVLALKFCLSHAAVSTVIPGMRKLKHLEANCAASDGKLLTHQELRLLSEHAFVHNMRITSNEVRPL
ncbi:hypothetical protein ES703_48519 [subsurface metagenome]